MVERLHHHSISLRLNLYVLLIDLLLNTQKFVPNHRVVRLTRIRKFIQILKHVVDLWVLFNQKGVQILNWLFETLCFMVSNFIFVRICFPRQWLVKEFQNHEEKRPKVIFPTQLFL